MPSALKIVYSLAASVLVVASSLAASGQAITQAEIDAYARRGPSRHPLPAVAAAREKEVARMHALQQAAREAKARRDWAALTDEQRAEIMRQRHEREVARIKAEAAERAANIQAWAVEDAARAQVAAIESAARTQAYAIESAGRERANAIESAASGIKREVRRLGDGF